MSLVILSNTSLYNGDEFGPADGIDRAYSFSNQLQTPLVIPKNSEVALQSLKINKDGTFQVGRSNSLFYQYIGTKLTDVFTFDKSPRHPGYTRIFPHGEVNANDFAESVENAMNKAIYHPDLQGLATCEVKRNSSTSFDGYELKYDKASSASGTNTRPSQNSSPTNQADFVKGDLFSDGWEYTASNHRFHKRSGNGSVNPRAFAQISSAPLTCTEGNFQVSFKNASNWCIGLSRYCNPRTSFIDPDGTTVYRYFEAPDYWKRDGRGFYDFVACSEKNVVSDAMELRLYHTVKDTGTKLEYREVDYWNASGSPVTGGPYNLTTNASAFDHIKFTVDGEAVDVTLTKGTTATPAKICSPSYQPNSNKSTYFKPVAQTCTYLYGKMEIRETEANDRQGDYLTISQYDSRDITGFNYDGYDTAESNSLPINQRLTNHDWYATLVNLKTPSYLIDVDTRLYNDMSAADHTFVRTSGGKINYTVVPILSQSDKYQPTNFANTEEILGFNGASPMETPSSFNGSQLIFTSSTVPQLISNQSVFVRLNGLTQRSTNGATGNQSHIIYHCPRFDNSGNQTGGLFFEPGEKTYLDLNNATDIQVNNLGIDFVDKRERYMKSVVGSSVVCLHIRPKK
jgi:hypothetical protein